MDEVYNSNGIVLKTWFTAKGSESKNNNNSYYVWVSGWNYHRRIIERDGLISFQVTVHCHDCYNCKERVCFVKQQLADQSVQCFWTYESDDASLYVTVGPPPQRVSVEMYLSFLLGLPVVRYSSPSQGRSKQRQTKAGSRNRRHIVQ